MSFPLWANEQLSALLPGIRQSGESQLQEFKEDFPEQSHKLATEVAAFATSGTGLILIGVRDDGTVNGLDPNDRDRIYHRAQNIVRQVQPLVKCDISYCYDGGFVLVLCIRDDQTDPVFYYEHRPYIRDGKTSRPATPDEVKTKIWSHGSSDHKKRMEDLRYQITKSAIDQSEQRTVAWDELALRSASQFATQVHESLGP